MALCELPVRSEHASLINMKHIVLIAMFCFVAGLLPTALHAQDKPARNTFTQTVYSSIASDLPLMPGMVEKPETLVMFDTPEGRIAEISMDCPHGEIEVLAYYRETLPALGWRAENPQVWSRRSEEMLTIRFTGQRGVTFHLEPLPPEVRSHHKSAPNW